MRIQIVVTFWAAAILTGCSSLPPRTSSGYVEELARHADRNRGQLLSSGGPLLALRQMGDGAVLRIATQNYGRLFDVTFPQYPGDLTIGREVSFLGTLQGAHPSKEAYSGTVLLIDGIALKPVGGPAILAGTNPAVGQSWLRGELDLSAGAPAPSPVGMPPAAPAPARSRVGSEASVAVVGTTAAPKSRIDAVAAPGKPSRAVGKMLDAWSRLSEVERADFLRRAGISP